jgi:hypothetical protein
MGALLHGSGSRTDPPSPERNTRHSIAVGQTEVGHRVEDRAREFYLNSLPIQGPASHTCTGWVSGTSLVAAPGGEDFASP